MPEEAWSPRTRAGRIRAALADLGAGRAGRAAAEAARAEEYRRRREAGERAGCPPASAAVQLAEEQLARVTAAQQARIEQWQARDAASLAATGRPLGNPPRRPAGEHCWVKAAAARVEAARAREQAAERRAAEREKNRKGPGPVRNVTDPDSRLMPARGGGFTQGYNAENVTSEDGLIIATELTDDPTDMAWFEPMMSRAQEAADLIAAHRPASPGPDPGTGGEQEQGRIGQALADAGYCSAANLTCPARTG